jgi:hypothetical protein
VHPGAVGVQIERLNGPGEIQVVIADAERDKALAAVPIAIAPIVIGGRHARVKTVKEYLPKWRNW